MILPFVHSEDILNKWYTYFNYYKSDILDLQSKLFNQEDYKGTSKIHYRIQQYYLAFDLVKLIWLELSWNSQPWSYYETKYDLDNKRRILGCLGIDLDVILNIFGISTTTNNDVQIFGCILSNTVTTTYDINELLENVGTTICENNIY
jgi:hypothetical protein